MEASLELVKLPDVNTVVEIIGIMEAKNPHSSHEKLVGECFGRSPHGGYDGSHENFHEPHQLA